MSITERELENNTVENLGERTLERIRRIPSENWHSIPPHVESKASAGDYAFTIRGYETTMYVAEQPFEVKMETVVTTYSFSHRGSVERRLRILNSKRDIALEFPLRFDREQNEFEEKLEREVTTREEEEQATKRKALQIDLESAFARDSKRK